MKTLYLDAMAETKKEDQHSPIEAKARFEAALRGARLAVQQDDEAKNKTPQPDQASKNRKK